MKKIFTLSIGLLFAVTAVMSQACGSNGSSVCTPAGGPVGGGFGNSNNFACAEQNLAYSYNIQFSMYDYFDYLGGQNVDSIEFVSINNLPCGLCWAVNKASKRYVALEDGCIKISGTTNDAVGQYKLDLSLKAWINGGGTGLPIPASLVDSAGIRMYLRVQSAGGSCAAIDTTPSALNLLASVNCPLSIEERNENFLSLNVSPNPMNNSAEVRFMAIDAGNYVMAVTDASGRIVQSTELETKIGENKIIFSRENLNAGIYFISVGNSNGKFTKRITIAD